MLLDTETRNVTAVGVMQVARATIKTRPKIFNFFSDQTYADKPKAICRELVANAFDSHVMAGKADVPVEVLLPTMLEPTFEVRDRGLGMSHDFMMTSFMCYADGSTKDQSNLAIGGFGIGSKSPFSYVDQYNIKSLFDGVESVYSIFKDEDGIPAIGLLGQRPTTEPNGVTVSLPVKPEDFATFEKAAFEALRYFEPLPDIKNAAAGAFIPPSYAARGDTWAMRPSAGDLAIIMGGIRYPVNAASLTYKFPDGTPARKLLKYGLDLRLPIGSCSIALSREHLSYDDATILAIRTACEAVIDDVAASFATMFDHIESEWDARVALDRETGGANSYSDRGKFLAEHAKWKGEPLATTMKYPMLDTFKGWKDEIFHVPGYTIWNIDGRDSKARKGRGGKVKKLGSAKWETPAHGFRPANVDCLIIDDLPRVPKSKAVRKIKEFASRLGQDALVIRVDEQRLDKITTADILKGFGSPPEAQVVLTSDLPEPYDDRVYKERGRMLNRPKVRMFSYDGSQQRHSRGWLTAGTSCRPERNGVYEISYEDQPATGILVVCEQFEFPEGLRDVMKHGLIEWRELRFVNSGDAKKLAKGKWTGWAEEHERRKKALIAEYPQLPARLAVAKEEEFGTLFRFMRSSCANLQLTPAQQRSPFGRILNLYRTYVEALDPVQQKLAAFVTPKMPKRIEPSELVQQFNTKQWKAARLLHITNNIICEEETMKLFLENL